MEEEEQVKFEDKQTYDLPEKLDIDQDDSISKKEIIREQ